MRHLHISLLIVLVLGLMGTSALAVSPGSAQVESTGIEYDSISAAIEGTADEADTILVGPGRFLERLTIPENKTSLTLKSQFGPWATIIDAEGQGTVVVWNGAAGLLEGFTLTGGDSGDGAILGGPWPPQEQYADVIGCVMTGNNNSQDGCLFGNMQGNRFAGNMVYDNVGGQALSWDICGVFENNIFYNNHSNTDGFRINDTTAERNPELAGVAERAVRFNTFYNNTIHATDAPTDTRNGLIGLNGSTVEGLPDYPGAIPIENNIFWGNIRGDIGEGISLALPDLTEVVQNILDGDSPFAGSSGNSDEDPVLDYRGRVMEGSPAIDAAVSDTPPAKDVDGQNRPIGGGYDIGASEYSSNWPYWNPMVHNTTQNKGYREIQTAVDTAESEDVIDVYPGIYSKFDTGENVVDDLIIKSVSGPAVTTITARNDGYVVNWRNNGGLIEGFTITEGNSGDGACFGGPWPPQAKYCDVIGNVMVNNVDTHDGCLFSNMQDCRIAYNVIYNNDGGQALSWDICGVIENNLIYNNISDTDGFRLNDVNAERNPELAGVMERAVRHNTFFNNIVHQRDEPTDTRNGLICLNGSSVEGHPDYPGSIPIHSNIFFHNTMAYPLPDGVEVSVELAGLTDVANNALGGDSSPYLGQNGNFGDAPGLDYNGRLITGSPCIDAGDIADAPDEDLDGIARPFGDAPDVGAYEWTDQWPYGDPMVVNLDTMVSYPDIQSGIDEAEAEQTLEVYPGTYDPIRVPGEGPAGLIIQSAEGPDETAIDGLYNGVLVQWDVEGGRIEGFTLTRGSSGDGACFGGPWPPKAKGLDIVGNIWVSNINPEDGSLIANQQGILISDNIIINNNGGQALAWDVCGVFQNNYVGNNISATDGFRFNDTNAENNPELVGVMERAIRNNTFVNNLMHTRDEPTDTRNGLIGLNGSNVEGHPDYAGSIPVVNNIFWGNSNVVGGTTASLDLEDFSDVTYNVLGENSPFIDDEGNFSEDPMLHSRYYLRSDSPCIDAGTADNAPAYDFRGDPRPIGDGIDIGCDEYNPDEVFPAGAGNWQLYE